MDKYKIIIIVLAIVQVSSGFCLFGSLYKRNTSNSKVDNINAEKNIKKDDSTDNTENKTNRDSLNESEIEELRTEYPLIKSQISTVDYVKKTFKEVAESSQAIVDAEVLEILEPYEVSLKLGEQEDLTVTNYVYKMKVLSVLTNDGAFDSKEQTFTLVLPDYAKDNFPEMSVGSEGIFPIYKGEGIHDSEYTIARDTYYYVTHSGYVLSAYEEEDNYVYTGQKKDDLIQDIQTINNDYCKKEIEDKFDVSLPESIDIIECKVDDDNIIASFYINESELQELQESVNQSEKLNNEIEYEKKEGKIVVNIS